MGKILDDEAYREIFWDVAREHETIDFELLRSITELEESKIGLGRRHGIYQELRHIINKHLDKGGM